MMHEEPEPDDGNVTLVRTPGGTTGQEGWTADGGSGWARKEGDGVLTHCYGDGRF